MIARPRWEGGKKFKKYPESSKNNNKFREYLGICLRREDL